MSEMGHPEGSAPGEKQFIRETIQEPPRQERKLGRLIGLVIAMGALFGVTASIAFNVSGGWLRSHLPAGGAPMESVDIVQDETTREAATEEITSDPAGEVTASETEETSSEFPAEIAAEPETGSLESFDLQRIREIAADLESSLVTVTTQSAQMDVFKKTYTRRQESSGVIIAITGSDIRILTDSILLEKADSVYVTLSDGSGGEAVLLGMDGTTGIAVISLPIRSLPEGAAAELAAAKLGNSYLMKLADPAVALGDPLGYLPSLAVGFISHVETNVQGTDFVVQKLYTDIPGCEESGGILVNIAGEIVGWITTRDPEGKLPDYLMAYSISDLKGIIEKLSNGSAIARLGVRIQPVTGQLALQRDMPRGLYVTDLIDDSPALGVGIRNGDILIRIDSKQLQDIDDLQRVLMQTEPGTAVGVAVMRKGRDGYEEQSFEVTLDER